jgi:hypothetical protein
MGCVTLLPQELTSSQKWSGVLEFPSDNVGPLIQLERQITVTLDPITKGRVHDGFTGWTNGNGKGQVGISRFGDPCHFWAESFNVVLFLLQTILGDKHGKVGILDTKGFDLCDE